MKFTSIFFKASAVYIRGLPQIYKQTSEKYEVYFNIFQSDDAKIASFATTEALASQRSTAFNCPKVYIRGLLQIYKQTSEKYEVYFNIFQSDDAKTASFATTEALASQRSTILTVPKYTFKVSSKIDRNEQKYI